MSLLKSAIYKLMGLRLDNSDGGGDYYTPSVRKSEPAAVNWSALAHPSVDNFGRPIYNAYDYCHRKRLGCAGPAPSTQTSEICCDDDELLEPEVKTPLKFTNSKNLQTPSATYLRGILPRETHRFLATDCKKDCRVWLWKNEAGRKARAFLILQQQKANLA